MKKLFYAIAALIAAGFVSTAATRSPKSAVARNIDVFNSVMKELQTNYVDSIDVEASVRTAIDAMLETLDPYTEYIPRDKRDDFNSQNNGEYAGIGAMIVQRDGGVYIEEPYAGAPSAKAGLKAGDLIVAIDGDTMLSKPSSTVSERLRGAPGSTIKVTVKRPYTPDSILVLDVTREKIRIPSVPYFGTVAPGIGYIALTQFTDKSADEVKTALKTLMDTVALKGLVFDLRDNGGGYLESAVKILGYFLPKDTEVLRTRGKGILNERVYKTTSKPIAPDLPLVVLTDGNTASASEITSGALQDLDRAVIMGSRTFGKGLVQTTRDLPYDGLLKVTVAKYYIPSGRLIQAIDYSHRNPDGTPGRIPDSLTTAFTTASGRIVRDGGGITPDVEVTYPEVSRVTFNVVRDNWASDYATRFASTHPSIAPAGQFEITDSIFEDFKNFIDPAKFQRDKVLETIIDRLRQAAQVEGYMTDSLSTQIDHLASMMKKPLDEELDANRATISPYLARAIVERYYYQAGGIENALRTDPGVDSAVSVLSDPARYRQLLAPVPDNTKTPAKK